MRDIYAQYGCKPRGQMIRSRDGETRAVFQSPTRVRPVCLALQNPPRLCVNVLWTAGA